MILIPAHNEAPSIVSVVTAARQFSSLPVVVIDDCSHDATAALASEAGATVLRLPLQLGAWGATQAGLRYAQRRGCRHVVTLDADGQHEPAEISRVLRPVIIGATDVCIGACPSRASRARRVAWAYFRYLSGLSYEDITSGFRAYNRAAIDILIHPEATLLDYQDVGVLMVLRRNRLRVQEVPVQMNPRAIGKSQIFASWWKVAHYMVVTSLLAFAAIGRAEHREHEEDD
ncbi:MAG: glycosyltransferase family 2 protein [Chromatiaceae bacterium]|nr:glycosyltransferase family 2 protein [Chromatiaceae bacterium]MCF7993344.1 glycosyltransferase family 2 protein [Chromatiaceae bacterium]MCF8014858.1 glycosyltransferase family 2 protein [Chromatiaceae bacterium]